MKIAIDNAILFDGYSTQEPRRIVMENGIIIDSTEADTVIDGTGCTLLPGLIESHGHLYDKTKFLKMALQGGINTMMDMGIRKPEQVEELGLRNLPGLPQVFSSCGLIFAPGSKMYQRMDYPEYMVLKDIHDVPRLVDHQVELGADYIKLIFEDEGRNDGVHFPVDVGRAVVERAHGHGKLVVAHCVSNHSYQTALDVGLDIIAHIPYTEELTPELAAAVAKQGISVVPTVIMGKNLIAKIADAHPLVVKIKRFVNRVKGQKDAFDFTIKTGIWSLQQLYKANAMIVAGTDSTLEDDKTPASVPYGEGLHQEFELYAEAGIPNLEILQSATSRAADIWKLHDRGVIAPGKRADLILVRGNPVADISCLRNVERIWIAGKEASLDT